MRSVALPAPVAPRGDQPPIDPVGPSWLVTVRWTTVAAGVGAVLAGRGVLQTPVPLVPAFGLLALSGLSNLWLTWRVRAHGTGAPSLKPGPSCAPTCWCSRGCCSSPAGS